MVSNWSNWQYLAGVGGDPRGKRHFDLDKQTRQYDPEARFINKWQGHITHLSLDSVDAADWPLVAGKIYSAGFCKRREFYKPALQSDDFLLCFQQQWSTSYESYLE